MCLVILVQRDFKKLERDHYPTSSCPLRPYAQGSHDHFDFFFCKAQKRNHSAVSFFLGCNLSFDIIIIIIIIITIIISNNNIAGAGKLLCALGPNKEESQLI
jgi:hypothetical protein